MKTIKGPGIFLAQFAGDTAPFNTLENMARWAAGLGFVGVQIPTWDKRLIDLKLAAESQGYCEQLTGMVKAAGLKITELSTHLQGQLVAGNPAYDTILQGFAPEGLDPKARQQWAVQQLNGPRRPAAILASRRMPHSPARSHGPTSIHGRSGPPASSMKPSPNSAAAGLPILNAFEEAGVDACFELHPGEDLHDGVTFERFLAAVNNHPRANILYDPSHMVLQQLDYLDFLDIYHERVRAFHVKDAEFRPNGRSGVYGGYQEWIDRPGRFRSLGDGQVDFHSIFSKMAQYDYPGLGRARVGMLHQASRSGSCRRARPSFANTSFASPIVPSTTSPAPSTDCAQPPHSGPHLNSSRSTKMGAPGLMVRVETTPSAKSHYRRLAALRLTVISFPVTAYLRRSTGDDSTRLVTGCP